MKSKERKSPHHSFLGSLFVFFFSVVTIFSSNIEPIGRTFLYGVIGAAPWCRYIFLDTVCNLFGRLAHKSSFWARSATVSAKHDRTSAEREHHTRPENQVNDFEKVYLFGSNNLLLMMVKGSNTMLMVHKRGILVNFIHVTYSAHILHLKITGKWHSWSDFVINDLQLTPNNSNPQ